ncbi:MAG: ferritin [Pseudobacteriovorax sp.]|nr:ferritin [Pseudobacteriovorax sp.]
MIDEKLNESLNNHVNRELYSSYLYISMSAYFASIDLNGLAQWMKIQAQEEMSHAEKFFDFINGRGGRVILQSIAAPENQWESPLKVFEDTLAHEIEVTKGINELVDVALKTKDHATHNFLQWFVAEQVEEEATANTILQKLRLIKDDTTGLFMLDAELGKRKFTTPTP